MNTMTEAQIAAILTSLKVDLQITTTAYDTRLSQIIQSSAAMIEREGATLDYGDIEDAQLIIMYSAWIWRRRDTGEGMPRMLRWALNNKILGEKAR